jgi:hypothetical protein
MLNKIVIILLLVSISSFVFSQGNTGDNTNIFVELQNNKTGGNINIYENPTIRLEMEKHLKSFSKKKGIYGYRIQIFFGSSKSARNLANSARVKFISTYKDTKAHLEYTNPYWKVRVGDYRSQSEALKFLQEIQTEYPEAFIVKAIIEVE